MARYTIVALLVLISIAVFVLSKSNLLTPPIINEKMTLRLDDERFQCIAFSPDGDLLAAGTTNGAVAAWDIRDGKQWLIRPAIRRDVPSDVLCIKFSQDGRLAWGGWNQDISILDVKTKEILTDLSASTEIVTSLAFHPARNELVTANFYGIARIWSLDTRKSYNVLSRTKQSNNHSVAVHPNGSQIAVGCSGKVATLNTVSELVEMDYCTNNSLLITCIAYSKNGKMLVGLTSDNCVTIWEVGNSEPFRIIKTKVPGRAATCLSLSPDGTNLAVGVSGGIGENCYLEIWNVQEAKRLVVFPCHSTTVTQAAWSPNGSFLATCSYDRTVKLWATDAILKIRGK